MRKYLFGFALGILAFAGFSLIAAPQAQAQTADVSGWAWSSNIGWISFHSGNLDAGSGAAYKVTVAQNGLFDGYAWSSNVGWISFKAGDVIGCPASESAFDTPGVGAPLPPGVNNICTPRVDLVSGKVSGWARVISMIGEPGGGWLHLSGTNHPTSGGGGVTLNPSSHEFSGFAWESTALGWVSFASSIPVEITPPPQTPGSLGGSCTVNGGNSATINQGGSINFAAVPTGGTAPYISYLWATGIGNDSGTTPTHSKVYPTAGIYTTGVTVTDSNSATAFLTCGTVTVNDTTSPDALTLRIGRTAASATQASTQLRQGTKFALKWNNTLAATYRCSTSVTGTNHWSSSWNDDAVDPIEGSVSGSLSNLSTSVPVQRGVYTFGLSCVDTADPPGPIKSSSATLRVVSAIEEEF